MADHGTRQSYADGCRCPACKTAQSIYRRENKARKAGADIPAPRVGRPPRSAVTVADGVAAALDATVTALPGVSSDRVSQPRVVGPAEQAVLDELSSLTSAETRKGAVQAALAMARILDNPVALAQQKGAADSMVRILEDLRKGSARRKGRLASVQAMTKSSAAETGT